MPAIPFPPWLFDVSNRVVLLAASLLVQTTIIILAGFTGSRLVRKRGAAAQSFVLRATLAAALLCPVVSPLTRSAGIQGVRFEIPFVPDRIADTRQEHETGLSRPVTPESPAPRKPVNSSDTPAPVIRSRPAGHPVISANTAGRSIPAPGGISTGHIPPASPAIRFPEPRRLLFFAFTLLWLGCSVAYLVRLGFHLLYVVYLRRTGFEAKPAFIAACREAAGILGIRTPALLQHPAIRSPFLAGLLRPCIFLPLGVREQELTTRTVFIHELAHLHRHDTLWNLFRHLSIGLIPFQPLFRELSRRIEETSDFVCDDYVLRYGGNRAYATELVSVAQAIESPVDNLIAGVGFLSARPVLYRRVARILDSSRKISLRIGARMLVFVSTLCLCCTFFSGLIGFRGKSFAQVRRAAESFQKGRMFAALAVMTSMKNQNTKPVPESIPESPVSTAPAEPAPEEIAPAEQSGPEIPLQTTGTDQSPVETVVPLPESPGGAVSRGNEPSPDRPVMTELAGDGIRSASPPVITAAESSEARAVVDTLLFSGPRLLHSTAVAGNDVAAPASGPLNVEIPELIDGVLKQGLEQGQENPVWSPSGSLIAFTGFNGIGIWAISPRGGRPTLIYDNSGDISSGAAAPSQKAARILGFTPDGAGVTIMRYRRNSTVAAKSAETESSLLTPVIETIDFSTGERRVAVENASDGCWSPDGRYFAYVEGDYYGIGVLDAMTGERKLISSSGKCPCFTSDGKSIIYIDWDMGATDQLFRAPLSGGKPEQLTFEDFWWSPRCSPDGEWVLCSGMNRADFGSYSRIRAYNLLSRRAYDIFVGNGETTDMGSWSPTGRQFCYTLFGGIRKNGVHVRTSSIRIDNFSVPATARSVDSESQTPLEFKLIGNFPNPFNPSTTIRFSLPSAGYTELSIYNSLGQKVRDLVAERRERGDHSVVWDGRDHQGKPVSSGTYISRLKMEGKVESRRMALVK